MADAPEKIWVQPRTCTVDASGASRLLAMNREFAGGTQYTRTDLHLALVAAEREACADLASAINLIVPPETVSQRVGAESIRAQIATALRSLTPADAQAALEKVKREARNEAIEATLAALQRHSKDEWVKNLRVPHVKRMIALMEDTDDE